MQGRRAVGFRGIHVYLLLEEGGNCGTVLILDGVDEAEVGGVDTKTDNCEQDPCEEKSSDQHHPGLRPTLLG